MADTRQKAQANYDRQIKRFNDLQSQYKRKLARVEDWERRHPGRESKERLFLNSIQARIDDARYQIGDRQQKLRGTEPHDPMATPRKTTTELPAETQPTITKQAAVKASPIVLDKKGVETSAGQMSSEISPEPTKLNQPAEEEKGLLQRAGEFIVKDIQGKTFGEDMPEKLHMGTVPIVPAAGTSAAVGSIGRIDDVTSAGTNIGTNAKQARETAAAIKAAKQYATRYDVEAIGKAANIDSKALANALGQERVTLTARAILQSYTPKAKTLTSSVLTSKLGLTIGAAATISSLIGTIILGRFQIAEATDKYGIAIQKAADIGDWEQVDELTQEILEITNEDNWNSINSWLPIVSSFSGISKNVKAAERTAKTYVDYADAKRAEALGDRESQFAMERRLADEAARERELQERMQDEEYYKHIQEEVDKARMQRREDDEKFFASIEADRRQRKLQESEFYEGIQSENLQREVDLARLWSQYYDAIAAKDYTRRDEILKQIEAYS